MRVFLYLILLFGLDSSVLADNPMCVPSHDTEGIKMYLYSPRTGKNDNGGAMREDGTDRYRPGLWLALACQKLQCRLVETGLKVRTIHPKNDYYECPVFQTLQWDLSALGKGERVVMMFQPNPLLKEGAVPTWYVSDRLTAPFVPFFERDPQVKVSVRIPTPMAEYPNRISIVSTRWVTSSKCSEQQEKNQECMRKTVRVQLREGTASQWLTKPWKGSPETAYCMLGYVQVSADFNRDYLWWVGDLDGDHKPDYLLASDDMDVAGFTLYLSSSAGPQQLVGTAGYHWTDMQCD